MPISRPEGRTGISVAASEACPDGSLTPAVMDAFSACVVSGARGTEIASVECPCASVSGKRQVL